MATTWMLLLMALMGNGSDLLDYLPTQDYWKQKGVNVTVDGLIDEIKPPAAGGDIGPLVLKLASPDPAVRDGAAGKIRAMGPGVLAQLEKAADADDPEVAARAKKLMEEIRSGNKAAHVRRLMAIRTLGEMKAQPALPVLRELAKPPQAKDIQSGFVADYAEAAIAAIEGKPYTRPHPASSEDAWLLPENYRLVIHSATRGGGTLDFDGAMKMLMPMPRPAVGDINDGAPPPPQDPAAIREEIVREMLKIAERTGNIRVDGITFGLAGEVGNRVGSLVVIARAQYDAAALVGFLSEMKDFAKETKVVDGITVFHPDNEFGFMFPSDRHAVLVGGPNAEGLPIAEVAAALRAGKGKLGESKEMADLIKTIDTKQPLWGAAKITESYRQAPPIAPFDTVTLVGSEEKDKSLKVRIEGKGTDAQQVQQSVATINQGLDQARQEIKRSLEAAKDPNAFMPSGMLPMMKLGQKIMDSTQCQANGATATMTGTLPAEANAMILMGGAMFGMRVHHAEAVAPEVVAPPVEVRPDPVPPRPVPPPPG